jgi:hypothetical protein
MDVVGRLGRLAKRFFLHGVTSESVDGATAGLAGRLGFFGENFFFWGLVFFFFFF